MNITDFLITSVLVLLGGGAALVAFVFQMHRTHTAKQFEKNDEAHNKIEATVKDVSDIASTTSRKIDYIIIKHGFDSYKE